MCVCVISNTVPRKHESLRSYLNFRVCTLDSGVIRKRNPKYKQGGLCHKRIVHRRAQLQAAVAAVVGDDVVDVHVLGVEENKLAVAHDLLAQLGDQRMVEDLGWCHAGG